MNFIDYARELTEFSTELQNLYNTQKDPAIKQKMGICSEIISSIIATNDSYRFYDENCTITKEEEGEKIISIIKSNIIPHQIMNLFYILCSIVREAYLSVNNDVERNARNIDKLHQKIWICTGNAGKGYYFDHFFYVLPRKVLNKNLEKHWNIMQDREQKLISGRKVLENKLDEVDKKIKELNSKIHGNVKLVEKIEDKISYLKQESRSLDFGVLSNEINKLAEEKSSEKKWQRRWVTFFGILMMLPPIIIFRNHPNFSLESVVTFVPMLALEIILIYFFRIALQGYMSTKRQLLRLKYRASVSRFTNEYIHFVKEHDQTNSTNHLSKFEELIYREISFDDSDIPSPYDGLKSVVFQTPNQKTNT